MMSATVIDIRSAMRCGVSPQERRIKAAVDEVARRLDGKVSERRMSEAKARAERLVLINTPHDDVVKRACAWALYVVRDDEPKGAA